MPASTLPWLCQHCPRADKGAGKLTWDGGTVIEATGHPKAGVLSSFIHWPPLSTQPFLTMPRTRHELKFLRFARKLYQSTIRKLILQLLMDPIYIFQLFDF